MAPGQEEERMVPLTDSPQAHVWQVHGASSGVLLVALSSWSEQHGSQDLRILQGRVTLSCSEQFLEQRPAVSDTEHCNSCIVWSGPFHSLATETAQICVPVQDSSQLISQSD